jgi:hypothetical protein
MFPPPPIPGPVQPLLLDAPIRPGYGRVYVDVLDGPTNVRVVHSVTVEWRLAGEIYEDSEFETDQKCRTPCAFDMPLGHVLLAFPMRGWRQEEIVDVVVSETPSLYRRALGWGKSGGAGGALGILGVTFGGISFATGAALLPVGLATDKSGFTTSGAVTLGVGALLTAFGVWAISANPRLEQPGVGAQYELHP